MSMNKSDCMTYRMIVCSGCKGTQQNCGCFGSDDEIQSCIDAQQPMEESYGYGQ